MKIEKDPVSGIVYLVIETPCECECHKPGNTIVHMMPCCHDGFNRHSRCVANNNMPRSIFKKVNDFLAENIEKIQP